MNLNQILKKLKRLPQVVTPKDASQILAHTGIPTNAKILDAGSGSGFLAIFLAWYCSKGKVITYEKRKEFAEVVEKNIKKTGLKNIKVKNSQSTAFSIRCSYKAGRRFPDAFPNWAITVIYHCPMYQLIFVTSSDLTSSSVMESFIDFTT